MTLTGTKTIPFAGGKNDFPASFGVSFPQPMPDAQYTLQVTFVDPHGLGRWFTVRQRTPEGFTVAYDRPRYVEVAPVNQSLSPCEVEVHWQAAA